MTKKRETAADRAARMKKTPAAYDRQPEAPKAESTRGPVPTTDEDYTSVAVPKSLRQRLKELVVRREQRTGEREVIWRVIRDGLDALGEDAAAG